MSLIIINGSKLRFRISGNPYICTVYIFFILQQYFWIRATNPFLYDQSHGLVLRAPCLKINIIENIQQDCNWFYLDRSLWRDSFHHLRRTVPLRGYSVGYSPTLFLLWMQLHTHEKILFILNCILDKFNIELFLQKCHKRKESPFLLFQILDWQKAAIRSQNFSKSKSPCGDGKYRHLASLMGLSTKFH